MKRKIQVILKNNLIPTGLTIVLIAGSLLSSCQTPPKWDGHIFAGDSKHLGISRAQEKEFVSCAEPIFDDYVCMSSNDFRTFVETYIQGCAVWKNGKHSDREISDNEIQNIQTACEKFK